MGATESLLLAKYPEYQINVESITNKDAREAFNHLLTAAIELPDYDGELVSLKTKRTFRYYWKGNRSRTPYPFDFIINRGSLLFFLRDPSVTNRGLTIKQLKAQHHFPDVEPTDKGEIRFRLSTEEHARRVMRVVFSQSTGTVDVNRTESTASGLVHSADETTNGAGFGDPVQNKLVEDAAIKAVTKHYEKDGWAVRSVEPDKCGFDLKCQKGRAIENVEVKGIRGTERSFFITVNEARAAKSNPNFILMVVTSALSKSPVLSRYSGSEFCRDFELSPVIYRAVLRRCS